jgi:hypothetical protein
LRATPYRTGIVATGEAPRAALVSASENIIIRMLRLVFDA